MKGIIFDFNGTLFWDTKKHNEAWIEFSKQIRGFPFTEEELFKTTGQTNRLILEYITGGTISKEESLKLSLEKEKIYREKCKNDPNTFHLAPGAEDLLNFLKEKKIPITIASSSEETNINFFIEGFKLEKWFDISKIIYDKGLFPGKPYPDMYVKASEVLNLNPSDCIVFEDTLSGIKSAYDAGIGKIFAITSEKPYDFFQNIPGVTGILNNFNEFNRNLLK